MAFAFPCSKKWPEADIDLRFRNDVLKGLGISSSNKQKCAHAVSDLAPS